MIHLSDCLHIWNSSSGLDVCEKCGSIGKLYCVISNCEELATHEVRSGYAGCGYCDKHWNKRDEESERRFLMT